MSDRFSDQDLPEDKLGAATHRGRCIDGLCEGELQSQNDVFAGTGGISCNNRGAGFVPAYKNTATGEAIISRYADGRAAPVHLLEGLPMSWVAERDSNDHVIKAYKTVIAGFIYRNQFYTRDAAAEALSGAFAETVEPD